MFFEKYLNRIILYDTTFRHVRAGLVLSDNSIYSLEKKKRLDYNLGKGGIQIINEYDFFGCVDISFIDYETGSVNSQIGNNNSLTNILCDNDFKSNQLEIKYLTNTNNSSHSNTNNSNIIAYMNSKQLSAEKINKLNHKTKYSDQKYIRKEIENNIIGEEIEENKKRHFSSNYENAVRLLEAGIGNNPYTKFAKHIISSINNNPDESKYIDYPIEVE